MISLYEKEIIAEKEKCEKNEKETRAVQVNCESELKTINFSLNGIHPLLDKDHKELKGKIDNVNETIENMAVHFNVENGWLNESIEKESEYLERLQTGKIFN